MEAFDGVVSQNWWFLEQTRLCVVRGRDLRALTRGVREVAVKIRKKAIDPPT